MLDVAISFPPQGPIFSVEVSGNYYVSRLLRDHIDHADNEETRNSRED